MTTPDLAEAAERIAFDAFKGFSPLFRSYCAGPEALSPFFRYDFRSAADRAASASAAAAHPRDRDTLVRVLHAQNARWNADEATRAHIDLLADPETVAVVTGQQLGLFGGPLYTLLKTVTAIQLAERIRAETGRAAVPVFWLEGEDHDLEEIASAYVPRGAEMVAMTHTGAPGMGLVNGGPVGHIRLGDDIGGVLDALDGLLQPSDFHAAVMEELRSAYQPGVSFRDAFARLMGRFFPDTGLVLISPDDPDIKRLAEPLFRREIEDGDTAAALLTEVSGRLESAGFHAQVTSRPTNLFVVREGVGRLALDRGADGLFSLRGTDESLDRAAVLALIEDTPEKFSPNVVLRPLMQDLVLPTAVYVAGPGEVAYFAQFGPLYDWAGIPMPVIHPRASVTLVESGVRRNLVRIGRPIPAFEEQVDRLFSELVVAGLDVDLDTVFSRAEYAIAASVGTLREEVVAVDPSLGKTTDAMQASMSKELARLQDRVVRAERRRHDEMRTRLDRTREALFPGGTPQERVVSPLYFMNKYGTDLAGRLLRALSLDTATHQVVDL